MKAKELQELGQWKVGQLVHITGGEGYRAILPITKITNGRGGTIYAGRDAFDVHGHQRTSDVWHSLMIEPATDEHRKQIRATIIKRHLSKFNWETITDDQAFTLDEFLRAGGIQIRPPSK